MGLSAGNVAARAATAQPGRDGNCAHGVDSENPNQAQRLYKVELKTIFDRDADLITRAGVEQSRNYLRRREILSSAQVIYAAGSSSGVGQRQQMIELA
ncbi:MAG: hypothetical protein AAF651_12900 [Cyanobacteria bacterium P01_C01_bin.73]